MDTSVSLMIVFDLLILKIRDIKDGVYGHWTGTFLNGWFLFYHLKAKE